MTDDSYKVLLVEHMVLRYACQCTISSFEATVQLIDSSEACMLTVACA